jgi:hypothetical protein
MSLFLIKYHKKVMRVAIDVYDFTDEYGESIIVAWRWGLTARSRGALDSKLNMLACCGMDLPPKLLVGPINKTGHIYKLRIKADVMLRPMLCKGPFLMDAECTMLLGASEVQGKLIPDPQKAVDNRNTLLRDRKRRVLHEW